MGLSYEKSGVSIKAGNEAIQRIKKHAAGTFGSEVIGGIGSFAALYAPDLEGIDEPVLVSGTDGVGTKLKVALQMDKHDTIGIDLVAMCINDILSQGARPLFFLDYLATGKLKPDKVEEIVRGIAAGCREAGCALIGGETAEMPGFYQEHEYDLAGFAVGLADRKQLITGENIRPGDKIIGLPSSGLHSNGFSLARKALFELGGYQPADRINGLQSSLGEELLKPTRIYVRTVSKLLEKFRIKGIAHVTGGGLLENLPRILPAGMKAVLRKGNWPVQTIFTIIQELGDVAEEEMYLTFNMGLGMVLVVSAAEVEQVISAGEMLGEKMYLIGEVTKTGADMGKIELLEK